MILKGVVSSPKKGNYTKYLKYIFFVVALGTIVSLPGKIIKVGEIKCVDQYGNCSDLLIKNLEIHKGKNLTSAKKEIQKVLGEDKAIKSYSQRFLLLGIIELNLITRKPFCLVSESLQEPKLVLVDSMGVNFGSSQTLSITPIKIEGNYNDLPENDKNKVLFACRTLKMVYNQSQIKSAVFAQNQLIIDFEQGLKVIFPVEGKANRLAGSLNLVLSRVNSAVNENNLDLEGKTIDLRFANPVIR